MPRKKNAIGFMDGAEQNTEGTATTERSNKPKKQVMDPITHEWRDETKAEKFRRLAVRRTNNALKRIRQIANLSSRAQYEYSEEQADKILSALQEAVAHVGTSFQDRVPERNGFSL